MTLEVVQRRLDKLLETEIPKVVLLTGDWGSGKTYQWKQAMDRASRKDVRPRYAYVSLFGLTSLAEVRKRITEEVMSSIRIPGRTDTVGEAAERDAIGLKPMQILKILPVIPYLGKLEALAQELSFATVRKAVVCFDDLERAPPSLRLADVFGLASFLKEERQCRMLLISNQKKLGRDAKDEFSTYLEKVVDETVDFAPTPAEACAVAVGSDPSEAGRILTKSLVRLGVSNIRVISRLAVMADALSNVATGLHPRVLNDLIKALCLFGVAHFIPRPQFPSPEFLMTYGHDWGRYAKKTEAEQTDQERRESEWEKTIASYGHFETSQLDKEVYGGLVAGFFRDDVIRKLAEELSATSDISERKEAFKAASRHFWWSTQDSAAALDRLLAATSAGLDVISATDLNIVYEVLLDLKRPDAAQQLLDEFISANRDRPDALELQTEFGEKYHSKFREALELAAARIENDVDLAKALDAIDFNSGWNPEDIARLAEAEFSLIVPLLSEATGKLLARRMKTLLKIGTDAEASDAERALRDHTIEWLKSVAAADPISEVRVRRLIPSDPGAPTAPAPTRTPAAAS